MSKLILVRGLPGSGKSTFAKDMCAGRENWSHVEADQYFMANGRYVFNADKLSEAHGYSQRLAAAMLKVGDTVVVSNTFTQLWEMEPYFKMGADRVTIVECTGHYGNVHGVPADKVRAMAARWERVTPEWLSAHLSVTAGKCQT